MPYNVFVSHSMAQEDHALLMGFHSLAGARGLQTYFAERDWQPGTSLPDKIERAIRVADCMVVFLTRAGHHSKWVHQEIGFAQGIGLRRIPIVEQGIDLTGFDLAKEYIALNRLAAAQTLHNLAAYLEKMKTEKERNQAGLVVGGLVGLWLLSQSEPKSRRRRR
jgi:hypothetical protein